MDCIKNLKFSDFVIFFFYYLPSLHSCVTCQGCAQIICRKPKCSDWIANRGESEWECKICLKSRRSHYRAGEWLLLKLNEKFNLSSGRIKLVDTSDSDDNFNASLGSVPLDQKEKVREFLEDLLSSMLGGSLDNIPVGQIRKSDECKY